MPQISRYYFDISLFEQGSPDPEITLVELQERIRRLETHVSELEKEIERLQDVERNCVCQEADELIVIRED